MKTENLMSILTIKNGLISVAFVVVLASFPVDGFARPECPSFPKVTFWGELTHETVRQHVEERMSGDWVVYLNQLQRQHTALKGIHQRGSGAVIKRKGKKIRLSGKELAKYLKFTKRRISVVRCLAELDEANTLADFSTAAGTPETEEPKKPPVSKFSKKKTMARTFLTIPKKLMVKLRKKAVRESLKKAKKVSVNDVVVEILKRELRKNPR